MFETSMNPDLKNCHTELGSASHKTKTYETLKSLDPETSSGPGSGRHGVGVIAKNVRRKFSDLGM
jgi:hypothetical protein